MDMQMYLKSGGKYWHIEARRDSRYVYGLCGWRCLESATRGYFGEPPSLGLCPLCEKKQAAMRRVR